MDVIQRRFDELERMGQGVADSKGRNDHVNAELFVRWRTSAHGLISRVFNTYDPTLQTFSRRVMDVDRGSLTFDSFQKLWSVFLSAKEQYEGGYLFNVRNLVHADVFSDELEQAVHFLGLGYKTPAAVIAGVVLETTLRKLCEQTDDVEPGDKLNRMNDDLAKAAVYNKMRADQIRAWAKIRNDAAHGNPDEFTDKDVELMIQGVRDFVANQLS